MFEVFRCDIYCLSLGVCVSMVYVMYCRQCLCHWCRLPVLLFDLIIIIVFKHSVL